VSAVSDQKAINLWTIWMAALAVVLLGAAYLVRDVLLLIYMSGLLAVGFSPIVRLIERLAIRLVDHVVVRLYAEQFRIHLRQQRIYVADPSKSPRLKD